MIRRGRPRASRPYERERIQSRSCIKLNINNSGLWSVRVASTAARRDAGGRHGDGVPTYLPIYRLAAPLRAPLRNTPRGLLYVPGTRLHLISGIVLNHRGSRGSPRVDSAVVTVARGCLCEARLSLQPGSNYWFPTHEYIIRRVRASVGPLSR